MSEPVHQDAAPFGHEARIELRAILAEHGFEGSPYTRLRVAAALTQLTAQPGWAPVAAPATAKAVAAFLPCTGSEANRGLRTLRKAGCLLDDTGNILLSHTARISHCISNDPLRLDAACVRAMTRVAEKEFDVWEPGASRDAFIGLVGRPPLNENAYQLAVSEVQAIATKKVRQGSPIGLMSRSLRRANLDPVSGRRPAILQALHDLVSEVPDELTPLELAAEVDAETSTAGAASILTALMRGGVVLNSSGEPAAHDEPVEMLKGSPQDLEEVCREVYAEEIEGEDPGILGDEKGMAAFERLLTEPRPIGKRELLAYLDQRGINPEPQVRTAILGALLRHLDGKSQWSMPDLLDAAVTEIPVTRRQVRNILNALLRAGLIEGGGPSGKMSGLRGSTIGELDSRLVTFYQAQARDHFPDLDDDKSADGRIAAAVGAFMYTDGETGLSENLPKGPAIRRELKRFRAVLNEDDRVELISTVARILQGAPEEGLDPRSLAELAAEMSDLPKRFFVRSLPSMVYARLVGDCAGAPLRGINSKARLGQWLGGTVDEAHERLVDYYIRQALDAVPRADPETVRLILNGP